MPHERPPFEKREKNGVNAPPQAKCNTRPGFVVNARPFTFLEGGSRRPGAELAWDCDRREEPGNGCYMYRYGAAFSRNNSWWHRMCTRSINAATCGQRHSKQQQSFSLHWHLKSVVVIDADLYGMIFFTFPVPLYSTTGPIVWPSFYPLVVVTGYRRWTPVFLFCTPRGALAPENCSPENAPYRG